MHLKGEIVRILPVKNDRLIKIFSRFPMQNIFFSIVIIYLPFSTIGRIRSLHLIYSYAVLFVLLYNAIPISYSNGFCFVEGACRLNILESVLSFWNYGCVFCFRSEKKSFKENDIRYRVGLDSRNNVITHTFSWYSM